MNLTYTLVLFNVPELGVNVREVPKPEPEVVEIKNPDGAVNVTFPTNDDPETVKDFSEEVVFNNCFPNPVKEPTVRLGEETVFVFVYQIGAVIDLLPLMVTSR